MIYWLLHLKSPEAQWLNRPTIVHKVMCSTTVVDSFFFSFYCAHDNEIQHLSSLLLLFPFGTGPSESRPTLPARDKSPTSPSEDEPSKRLREELKDNEGSESNSEGFVKIIQDQEFKFKFNPLSQILCINSTFHVMVNVKPYYGQ